MERVFQWRGDGGGRRERGGSCEGQRHGKDYVGHVGVKGERKKVYITLVPRLSLGFYSMWDFGNMFN